MNKYKNKKIIIDNKEFDSKAEANRYGELKLLQRAGEIQDLELQPEFLLQKSFKRNGKTHRAIKYIADFRYIENEKVVIEDTKGMETETFKLKMKLFLKSYSNMIFRISKKHANTFKTMDY